MSQKEKYGSFNCKRHVTANFYAFSFLSITGFNQDGESRLSKLEGTNNQGGFHPLGLALDGPTNQLLIANTPETRSASVDIYSIQDDRLHLIKSIIDPLLHSPNNVFPLPQSSMRSSDGHTPSFFFTNDHYFTTGWKKVLEDKLFLPLSSLMMYDARVDKVTTLLSGFAFANGVTGDANGTLLYVAETLGRRIWKFEITIPSDEHGAVKLKKVGQTQVPMAVDNLSVQDETGDVIAAGHPIGYKLLQYASCKDKANAAQPPSMVVRWKANGTAETILTDDGSTYGTSTTAIIDPLTGKLLVSSLFDSGILLCQTASQE
jgi:arylesterase/paraoxonase